ncbi:hypothetical protein FA15DRAFT_715894, partial [Coprinopsis marcescibilis]
GLQCFFCIYGLNVYLETPSKLREGRIPYILASWVILGTSASATMIAGAVLIPYLSRLNAPKIENIVAGGSLYEEIDDSFSLGWPRIVNVLKLIWVCLGDGLMLYRCFVVWNDVKWVSILPFMVYLFSLGMYVILSAPALIIVQEPKDSLEALPTNLTTLASTIFNILTTLLIVSRLLRWRNRLARALPSRKLGVYSGAMAILIESALPLTFFGAATSILSLAASYWTVEDVASSSVNTASSTGLFVVAAFYKAFTVISPQLIIFRVTIGRSFTNKNEVASTLSINQRRDTPVPRAVR